MEGLESRELLSTLPSAATIGAPVPITGSGGSANVNSNTPSVAIDPLNPNKLVAAWTSHNANGSLLTVVAAYSIDGGQSWNSLTPDAGADNQADFSQAPANGVQPKFTLTNNATVAFGRDEVAYLLSETTSSVNTAGQLSLQKWDFTTNTPAALTFSNGSAINPLYQWDGSDPASVPTLAVDNNVAGVAGQNDPYVGNVYVAWQSTDSAPKNPPNNFNPASIKLVSSSDGGSTFTHQAFVDDASRLNGHGGGNPPGHYTAPAIAISQGGPGVSGGQVTIAYDDYGTNSTAQVPTDRLVTQNDQFGGTAESFAFPATDITPATANGVAQGVDQPATTLSSTTVSINDPKFTSLSNIDLTVQLRYATLADIGATLTAPDGQVFTLFNNTTGSDGKASNLPGVIAGANLGIAQNGRAIGTVFDTDAVRAISDANSTAPYTAHFQPLDSRQLANYAGPLNGPWTLSITDYHFTALGATTPPNRLLGATLTLTSGLTLAARESLVGVSYLSDDPGRAYTIGVQSPPVLPSPSIASDNTLGTHSPNQGRLYLATTQDFLDAGNNKTNSTYVTLFYSDDGAQTWTAYPNNIQTPDFSRNNFLQLGHAVNDDNGVTDGFSQGGYAQPGSGVNPFEVNTRVVNEANVRPKLDPRVAVDPATGTVVVSFFDTRNDPSGRRVATYVAISSDGGDTFAPETYANASTTVVDAINHQTTAGGTPIPNVNLGPVPDNESSGNAASDATYGFGQRQGLAVLDGHIIPVWSSNQNQGSNIRGQKVGLSIVASPMTVAAGPRVIASTQGPVGEPGDTVNADRAADGSPVADTIVLTFDRYVNPASFPADGAAPGASPLQVFYNNPSGSQAPVPLRVVSVTTADGLTYTVKFNPAGLGVGTYTYTLRPLVRGGIPFTSFVSNNATQFVPLLDTSANSGQASFTVSGHPGQTLNQVTLTATAFVFQPGPVRGNTANDLQVFLVAQDGTQYKLYSTTTANGQFFSINATTTIPANAQALDQVYTVRLVDNVTGEQAELFGASGNNRFRLQLNNPAASVLTSVTGNLLDQNANGNPGEASLDAYKVGTGAGQLPLIVPGPHVTTTSVVATNNVAATGADNLVVNGDARSINVTFDRDIQVSSFTPSQVLKIIGPAGQINSPQTFTSTATSTTYAYNGPALAIPKAATTPAPTPTNPNPAPPPPTFLSTVIPIAGTNARVASLSVTVNITDPNDASLTLTLQAPDGTLIPLVAVNPATGTTGASGANFTNTTFSDFAPPNGASSTIAAGQAPYSLTYQSVVPLGTLAGRLLDGTWRLIIADSTTTGAAGRLNSWSLNVTPQVPVGVGAQLNSTLKIAYPSVASPDNSFTIGHLAVQFLMTSTYDGDIQVSLVAPDGRTVIPLVANNGGNGRGFNRTTLDGSSTVPIASGFAPFAQTYRPVGNLDSLNGLSINGTWTLRVTNSGVHGGTAALYSWSLIATPAVTVTPVNPVNGTARSFTVGFPTQQLSGSYTVTLGSGIRSVAADPANPALGAALDTNLNAGLATLRGGASAGPTTPATFAATGLPAPIPAGPTAQVPSSGVLVSQVNVTDNFAIQGDVNGLAGLIVQLNIAYPNDPDLTVTLTAPGPLGRTITLFRNVGGGSNPANFSGTILSDVTTPLTPITSGAAPFFGTFNPLTPLASLTTNTDGSQAFSGGLWTLTITNAGTLGRTGTLNGWSLTFQKPQTNTGLGEPVADQTTVGFRLFNISPNNPLANDTWTAVGPTGIAASNANAIDSSTGIPLPPSQLSGPVSAVAIDPADPSGNTAFVGASSGGVWKTNNFLTTDAGGPTYIPLTDFGANYSANIGSIAIFDRNGDPNQSIVFAGTGFGQATYGTNGGAAEGVGILKSADGGSHFTLLDSTVNVDANGRPLPANSPLRDHVFVGTTTYKIVVDPTPLPGGGVIVYAALGGANGGLWRSDDGGSHWQNLSASIVTPSGQKAAATDVLLDPASRSSSTGNLDILYAGFQEVGVFISGNRGQTLTALLGNVGANNLIQNNQFVPAPPLTVNDANTPNGAYGRIVLAKPALTGNAAQNILYQDWLDVAVENADGSFRGLYETKDRGENWTKAQIASEPTPVNSNAVTQALPTNDNLQTNNYDVTNARTGAFGGQTHNGNYAFSLSIDPINPNLVYLGGTQDFQTSGLIRVDLTGIYDAHAFVPFANNRNDGGALARDATGRVNVANTSVRDPIFEGAYNGFDPNYYLNLRHSPTNPFDVNSTQFVFNSSQFINDGTGVAWKPLDQVYGSPLEGSTNIHQILSVVDPVTGLTRLIIADDQGVFTGLYAADGTLDTAGIGTAVAVNGSRNGNLQNAQFYYGAAQPSAAAATVAGALFYGSGYGVSAAQSDPNLLSDGNLTYTEAAVRYGDLQNVIKTDDRNGSGIATDRTGTLVTAPSRYEYDEPFVGGDTTNFFRVNGAGQTTGLVNNFVTDFPGITPVYNNTTPMGNFAVNPLNGSQILISTNTGAIYETTNKGVQWLQISQGSLDGTYAPAVAYGAPDPGAPNGLGNLNNFIYAGTIGGRIFVTRTGGGPFTPLSGGLDGSSVVAIFTNPNRGTHEAYAVTLRGVYFMTDSAAANATWVNITGNLAQIQHNPFGSAGAGQAALAGFNPGAGQFGGFRSIVADYRYSIPDSAGLVDASGNPVVHPVLYVAGYGGVFRSIDNGQTWTLFPSASFDSAPVDGGYLPSVDVTNLTLNLGAVDPNTGRAVQAANDPEVLLATTFGRGAFAIRLAPDVLPGSLHFDPNLPAPTGSDTGVSSTDRVTSDPTPYLDGVSEVSAFGNAVTITLIDMSNGKVLATRPVDPTTGQPIASPITDGFGRFTLQIINDGSDPSFFQNSLLPNDKVVGVQATDGSGAKGNISTFAYTLQLNGPPPPVTPVLDPASDSGRSNGDGLTNVTAPTFDIPTTEPFTTTVELYRADLNGNFTILVGSAPAGVSPVMITDNAFAALVGGNRIYVGLSYEAMQVDQAGNRSNPSGILTIFVKNTLPPTLPAPALELASNSGLNKSQLITNDVNPVFDVPANALESPTSQLFLYRSTGGAAPIQVGFAPVGATSVMDIAGAHADGTYVYQVAQQDVFGNQSLLNVLNRSTTVTIDTQPPTPPTLALVPADDQGAPTHPGVTSNRAPHFQGTGTPGLQIVLFAVFSSDYSQGVSLGETTVSGGGTYLLQSNGPLADNTYTLVARTLNAAGNVSFSQPLVVTIKANTPQVVPTLSLTPADDTGLKGDGVTANRRPRFVGRADPGDTVTLYASNNGRIFGALATGTASSKDGSFQVQLPFDLSNGSTQLVAQASDIAGNKGPLSAPLAVRIISVAGDYYNLGYAQFTVFRPTTESYYVRNAGNLQIDTTPGRDVPVQYDFNGDGKTDLAAYRFDAAQYYGFASDGTVVNQQIGAGNLSLPVSGYYDTSGTLIKGLYNPDTATWAIDLPTPGGRVVQFGVAGVDIPAPAAYNGGGVTEIAVFRPKAVFGNDADSFSVLAPNSPNNYRISFTDPAVVAKGFVYQPGDIPAPADYDGLGRDEFAIYRPSTGQFFILNVPNLLDTNTWTLRTVAVKIPGGPKAGDVPVSEDYEGTGKASPTVYRPSNSTFYEIQTTTGFQQNIQFGLPGVDVAAAGPLLYRLSALTGSSATSDGYPAAVTSTGGGSYSASALPAGGGTIRAAAIAAVTTGVTPTAVAVPSAVALPTPAPVTPAASAPVASAAFATAAVAPASAPAASTPRVAVAAATPRAVTATVTPRAAHPAAPARKGAAPAKPSKPATAKAPAKFLAVHAAATPAKSPAGHDQHQAAVAAALKGLGPIRKGRHDD